MGKCDNPHHPLSSIIVSVWESVGGHIRRQWMVTVLRKQFLVEVRVEPKKSTHLVDTMAREWTASQPDIPSLCDIFVVNRYISIY